MASALSLLAAALLAEGAAYYFFLGFDYSVDELLYFLSLHGVASLLFATAGRLMLPPGQRKPRIMVIGLLFCFTYFIPLLGLIGILLAVAVMLLAPVIERRVPFASLRRPEFVLSIKETAPNLRLSGLRQLLLDESAPSDARLQSLIALQKMPGRIAGPMLRRLLADPSEDIRLIAYGMLDSQEKRINASIQEELDKLAQSPSPLPEERANSLRHAAELYWELVYTGLVQGDVRAHSIAQGLHYLELAQQSAPGDSGLWFLRGRLLQAAGDADDADGAFSLAVSCGLPETRVLPYLAEIAFVRRDFRAVREFLAVISGSQATTIMAPVIRFWQSPKAA